MPPDYSFWQMYSDFQAKEHWTGEQVRCVFQAVIVAIATRHADAVDVKFLVNGRPVWIALPHPAWGKYHRRNGKVITDPMAVQIAGFYLKTIIENGEESGREMYMLTVPETLEYLAALEAEYAKSTGLR
jgi:hypothetical protein